jgi:hypothetical protein
MPIKRQIFVIIEEHYDEITLKNNNNHQISSSNIYALMSIMRI